MRFYAYFLLLLFSLGVSAQKKTSEVKSKRTVYPNKVFFNPITPRLNVASSKESHLKDANLQEVAGRTPYYVDVSTSGATTFFLAFDLPKGVGSLLPSIGLSYHSQGGDAIAGWGWNIVGLSSITRERSNRFFDAMIDAVDFDQNDRFSLEGERLLLTEGNTYGADKTVYKTAQFSNRKIIAQSGVNQQGVSTPFSFMVHHPDGSRAKYLSYGGMEWPIDYRSDPYGNTILYRYNNSHGRLYIDEIFYGANSFDPKDHPNLIKFNYEDISLREVEFIGGRRLATGKLLKQVDIYTQKELFRTYKFEHSTSTAGYFSVSKITEQTATEKKPPIELNYDNPSNNLIETSHQILREGSLFSPEDSRLLPGDLNGDGKVDYIQYKPNQPSTTQFFVSKENGSQAFTVNTTTENNRLPFARILTNYQDPQNRVYQKNALTVLSEEIKSTSHITTNLPGQLSGIWHFDTYALNGNEEEIVHYRKSWNHNELSKNIDCQDNLEARIPKTSLSGDFNGDGILDILLINRPYYAHSCAPVTQGAFLDCSCSQTYINLSKVYFADMRRDLTDGFVKTSGNLSSALGNNDQLYASDFDGDGKTDLYHFQGNKVFVYTLDEQQELKLLVEKEIFVFNPDVPILLGDYNGDGKTDFMLPQDYTSVNWWSIYYATGEGFSSLVLLDNDLNYNADQEERPIKKFWGFIRAIFDRNAPLANSKRYFYIPQDVNGDGTTDMIQHLQQIDVKKSYGEGNFKISNHVNVYLNTFDKSGKAVFKFYTSFSTDEILAAEDSYSSILNINRENFSSGLTYTFIQGKKVFEYQIGEGHQKEVLLKTIAQKGIRHEISYQSLDARLAGSAYQQDYSQFYPYLNINTALNLPLTKQIKRIQNGQIATQDFAYRGAVTHAQGLGFLGFKAIGRTNTYGQGVQKIWNITEQSPQLQGAITKRWNSPHPLLEEPVDLMDITEVNYSSYRDENKILINVPESISHKNRINGIEHLQTFTYDEYYHPTRIYTEYFSQGKLDLSIDEQRDYFNNPQPTRNYYLGRLDKMVVTHSRGGQQQSTTTDYLAYENNLPTHLERYANEADKITLHNSYDAYGNLSRQTQSATDLAAQTQIWHYSSDGRFLETAIAVDGGSTHYSYHSNGSTATLTSPFNRKTSYTYDSFGRQKTATDYLGQKRTTQYQWENNNIVEYSLAEDGKSRQRITNPLGQRIHEAEKVDNSWRWRSFSYDLAGNLLSESQPYIAQNPSSNVPKTYYSYDGYGRESSLNLPSGQRQSIHYQYGTPHYTQENNHDSQKHQLDALGNIVAIDEKGGSLAFQYHPNGALKSSNYAGHHVSTAQDPWGRKSQLQDDSAGGIDYTFNAYGQLTREQTPWGTTTYGYNAQGLLEWKTQKGDETDLHTDYQYNAAGLLSSRITQDHLYGDTYSLINTYDPYHRLINATESNGFATFSQALSYNEKGQLTSEHRTAQRRGGDTQTADIRYTYDHSGRQKSIIYQNKTLWEVEQRNALEQISLARLGNGIVASRSYDALGFLNKINEGQALQLSLNYNKQQGVLNSRKRGNESTESFTHDAQNRLTQVVKDSIKNEYTYDQYSRLVENSTVGKYFYENTQDRYVLDSMYVNAQGKKFYTPRHSRTSLHNIDRKASHIHQQEIEKIDLVYNGERERVHAFMGNEADQLGERSRRKHYSTLFPAEITVSTDPASSAEKTVFYLGGDAYTAPVALINGAEHYLHRDHLGSILAISNASGSIVEERDFSPWGELRSLRMAGGAAISGVHSATLAFSISLLDRGFTGHEHFPQVNLIHMNGRLYDPRLKHFLAPDNNIIDPYDSRYYDRFAYAINNPLMVTDLSGESPETIAAIVKVLKVVYALYKIYDTIEGYTSNRYRGPIPAFFAAVAIAGGLDATGLVDVPLLKTEAGYSLGQAVVEIGKNILIPEGINLLQQQNLLNNYLEQQQQQQFALNQESEDFLPPPGSNISNINTSGVMTGGSGPFISESCVINCGEPADGEDDSDNVPEEEEEKQWYLDNDGDEYHAEERTANTMPTPGNWVITTKGEDCDDMNPLVWKLNSCDKCKLEPESTHWKIDDLVNNATGILKEMLDIAYTIQPNLMIVKSGNHLGANTDIICGEIRIGEKVNSIESSSILAFELSHIIHENPDQAINAVFALTRNDYLNKRAEFEAQGLIFRKIVKEEQIKNLNDCEKSKLNNYNPLENNYEGKSVDEIISLIKENGEIENQTQRVLNGTIPSNDNISFVDHFGPFYDSWQRPINHYRYIENETNETILNRFIGDCN